MKTAVSIPDNLFSAADKFAKETGISRSELYATALREFINRNRKNDITRRINAVCDRVDTSVNPQIAEAGRRVLLNSEW